MNLRKKSVSGVVVPSVVGRKAVPEKSLMSPTARVAVIDTRRGAGVCAAGHMQRIYFTALTPEQYIATEAHRQVIGDRVCPRCEKGRLYRHGTYGRGITGLVGQVLGLFVARFLCLACGGTVSYLPSFALSYRLVQAATFEAFLDGRFNRVDVQRRQSVLEDYRRRMTRFGVVVVRTVGCGFGRAPPAEGGAVWPWLKTACGGIESATRLLVAQFRITAFKRYQCHQPAGVR